METVIKYMDIKLITLRLEIMGSRGLVPLREGSEGRAEPLPFFSSKRKKKCKD
ncbi:MAG: hypothetical protein SFH39_05510 [Candidatus Magnetobacterium sp. LHC-1]|uniref:Uncharacterized protein n=1 Tax=Candidatus Magnetobacterium casense TaxID=1455061 RepID=A0ABS6RW50_9BACT|nr:hypothetical protein [Candidatus Magnetobacterium casensis]MBF0606140.1 hypothetical protein [Nitrospirota bacterium]MBV6340493.1 hypothetical protein [Candidatus Magnetobacterium casensis]